VTLKDGDGHTNPLADRTNPEMRYFKRHWSEDAGELCADWGGATYFFEVDDDASVMRQIQVFDNGNCLLHDLEHLEDQYGRLAVEPLNIPDFEPFAISDSEFEQHWRTDAALNWNA